MKKIVLKISCSFILVVIGIFSISVNAQIVYTDLNPDATSSGTYNLDLNNDGIIDFVIEHTIKFVKSNDKNCGGGTGTNNYVIVTPSNNNQIVDYFDGNVAKLAVNSTIDASTITWNNNNNQLMASYEWGCQAIPYGGCCVWGIGRSGQWATWNTNADDGFLGLKVISGGHSYYGWIRMNIPSDGSGFTIKDYAYNSTVERGIFAEQLLTENIVLPEMPLISNPLCAGNNVTVPYILTGTFSTSNIVTVELSDANGSFINPVAIGNAVSNVSGNINTVIPALTPSGTGYRMRVTSSDPARISYSNSTSLTVIGELPDATIFSTYGTTNLCREDYGVLLQAYIGSCYSYQWKLKGNNIPGATAASFSPTLAGDYSCVITNGVGSITSNIIKVTADPPTGVIIYAASTYCDGYVPLYTDGDYAYRYIFQWKLNGNDIINASTYYYNAATTGDYSCVKTNRCGNATSNTISITTIEPRMANATITAAGATTACTGPVILNANTSAGLKYQWYYNSTIIPGATNSSYASSVSGNYYVIETNGLGCTRSSNDISTVIGTPVVTIGSYSSLSLCNGNAVYLYAYTSDAGYISYQWIKDGVDISRATGQSYTVKHPGIYFVRVAIASGGCNSTSAGVQVTSCSNNITVANGNSSQEDFSSLSEDFHSLSVAPNPVSGSTKISFTLDKPEKVSISIYDVNGRLINTLADREFTSGNQQVKWNAANLNAGVYFLRMQTTESVQTRKLVVAK